MQKVLSSTCAGNLVQFADGRDAVHSPQVGVSRFTYEPAARMPFGHRHREQEEVCVVVSASGRAKLDDELIELAQWDVLRVAPAVMSAPSRQARTGSR